MAISLAEGRLVRVTWSLSDSDGVRSITRGNEAKDTFSPTNGSGQWEANAAWSKTFTLTGTNSQSFWTDTLPIDPFNAVGTLFLSNVKELLVAVSGPTGGYVTFSDSVGVAEGIRIPSGGQFHLIGLADGTGIDGGTLTVENGPTGTYTVEMTLVGVGEYTS